MKDKISLMMAQALSFRQSEIQLRKAMLALAYIALSGTTPHLLRLSPGIALDWNAASNETDADAWTDP
jgi:hypothetical protein